MELLSLGLPVTAGREAGENNNRDGNYSCRG